MAYKTNYIDVNKPAKVLSLNVTTINNDSQWPHNDGAGDKWYSGGSNPKYYRWEVVASITVKKTGKNIKIFFCISSCGAGLSFCCAHIVRPISTGNAPMIKKSGGDHGISPNKLKIDVGSFSERSFIHPKKG